MIFFGDGFDIYELSQTPEPDMEIHFRIPSRYMTDLQGRYGEVIAELGKHVKFLTKDQAYRVVMTTNELISNALKYREGDSRVFVKVALHHGVLVIEVHNNISKVIRHGFIRYISTLFESNLDKLYINQVEYLADNDDADRARLGLITVLKDCSVDLGYAMSNNDKAITRVMALARLYLENDNA